MKVHAFQVVHLAETTRPFEESLRTIWALPEADRCRTINYAGIRLESLSVRESLYEMEFSRPMYQDIGRLSIETPMNPIALDGEEEFGSYTAAIYDPARQYLFLQYNHSGARIGAIRDYVGAFAGSPSSYRMNFHLKDGIDSTSLIDKDVTKLKVTVNPKKISAADRAQGSGLISALLQVSDSLDGDNMTINISCRRKKGTGTRPGKTGLDSDYIEQVADFGDVMKGRDPKAFRLEFKIHKEKNREQDITEDILSYLGKRWVHEEVLTEATEGRRRQPLENKLVILRNAMAALR